MNRVKNQGSPTPGSGEAAPDKDLLLETTSSQTLRGLRIVDSTSAGYNPYNAVPGGGNATGMHRLDGMRRLSAWIRMKRDVDRAQTNEQDEKK